MIVKGTEPRPAESVSALETLTVTCPRCTGKGYIVCPECKGTGEERNVFWVVVGTCHTCVPSRKGFVTCPKCRGGGMAEAGPEQP